MFFFSCIYIYMYIYVIDMYIFMYMYAFIYVGVYKFRVIPRCPRVRSPPLRYRQPRTAVSFEDKRPLCQLSSKRLEDNLQGGRLSSTKHRLSGRRSRLTQIPRGRRPTTCPQVRAPPLRYRQPLLAVSSPRPVRYQRVRPNLVPWPSLVLSSLELSAHAFRALESCRHAGEGLPCCPVTSSGLFGAANGHAAEQCPS